MDQGGGSLYRPFVNVVKIREAVLGERGITAVAIS
jgi:hypothetical protein